MILQWKGGKISAVSAIEEHYHLIGKSILLQQNALEVSGRKQTPLVEMRRNASFKFHTITSLFDYR